MLTIIVVDSELETIPEEMHNDPGVRKFSQTRRKSPKMLLLDSNYLHTSIDRYYPGQSRRRGRPDIFHILLNVLNDSILNRRGELRVFIHTRNNKVITVNPEMRVPKSYNRFVGLIEDLFQKRDIVSHDVHLLTMENLSAKETIEKYSTGDVILMWPSGEEAHPMDIVKSRDMTVIIGGFSEGDFISDLSFIERKYSIFPEELTIWTVAGEIIYAFERKFLFQH